jgi:hypothetical protein
VWVDRFLMRVVRMMTGRNLLHMRPSTARFRFQLILSLLSSEWLRTAMPLLVGSFRSGTRLSRKHVMVELPPFVTSNGTVVFCRECPDATLHQGRLVPPCLRDRIAQAGSQYDITGRSCTAEPANEELDCTGTEMQHSSVGSDVLGLTV